MLSNSTIFGTVAQAIASETVEVHTKSNLLSIVNQVVSQWEFNSKIDLIEAFGVNELLSVLRDIRDGKKDAEDGV